MIPFYYIRGKGIGRWALVFCLFSQNRAVNGALCKPCDVILPASTAWSRDHFVDSYCMYSVVIGKY